MFKIANKRAWITSRVPLGSIYLLLMASCASGISGLTSAPLSTSFSFRGNTIVADHEEFTTKAPRHDRVADGGTGGTLQIQLRAFLQDGE
jgi:hypothetical protein